MATMISSTEVHGARLLREIAAEEGSLEDVSLYSNSSLTPSFPSSFSVLGHMKVTCISSIPSCPFLLLLPPPPYFLLTCPILTPLLQLLTSLRTTLIPNPPRTGVPDLDSLWSTHGSKLSITGRTLPLLHQILIYLVSPAHLNGTIALVDLTGHFSPSHLLSPTLSSISISTSTQPGNLNPTSNLRNERERSDSRYISKEDLQHIHVFRPTKSSLAATLASIESYMLYGAHRSHGREWLGVIVNGGVGGDINFGWRGWLRVERESVGAFGEGVSVEEVFFGERGRRAEVVDQKGWRAEDVSAGGGGVDFAWR